MPSKSAHKAEAAKNFQNNYKLFDYLSPGNQKRFAPIKDAVKDVTLENYQLSVYNLIIEAGEAHNEERQELLKSFFDHCPTTEPYHEAESKVRVAGEYLEAMDEFEELSGWQQFWAKILPAAIYGPADKYNKMAALKEVFKEHETEEDPEDYFESRISQFPKVAAEFKQKRREKEEKDLSPAEKAIRNELRKYYTEEQLETYEALDVRFGGKDWEKQVKDKYDQSKGMYDHLKDTEKRAIIDAQNTLLAPQIAKLKEEKNKLVNVDLPAVSEEMRKSKDKNDKSYKCVTESTDLLSKCEKDFEEAMQNDKTSTEELQKLFNLKDEASKKYNSAKSNHDRNEAEYHELDLRYGAAIQKISHIDTLLRKANEYNMIVAEGDVELKEGSFTVTLKKEDVKPLVDVRKGEIERSKIMLPSVSADVKKYKQYLTQKHVVENFIVKSYNDLRSQFGGAVPQAPNEDYQKMQEFKQMLDERNIDPIKYVPVEIKIEIDDREKDQTMIADLAEKTNDPKPETGLQTENNAISQMKVEEADLNARNTI